MVFRKRAEPTCCVFVLKLKYPAEVKLEKWIILFGVKQKTKYKTNWTGHNNSASNNKMERERHNVRENNLWNIIGGLE